MGLSFAEWEAQRKSQQAPAASTPQDEDSILPAESTRYEPGLRDASEGFGYGAAAKELARTAGETAIGVAKSPIDLLSGLLHPIDSVVGTARALAHPIDTITNIGEHPREGGSLLGQLLLAPKVPEAAKFVAEKAPPIIGNTMSAVGRGAEAVGGSKPVKTLAKLGPLEALMRNDWMGMAAAAAPAALEYGGQALQKMGGKIASSDVLAGLSRAVRRVMPGEQLTEPTAADSVKLAADTAREYQSKGMSRKQANQRAGYDIKSTEVPLDRTELLSPSKADLAKSGSLKGLEKAATSSPVTPDTLDSRISGLMDERRSSAGSSPTGTERRGVAVDEPMTGSVAERIARMRQEDPNIDAKGAEMFRKGYHGKSAGGRK